MWQTDDGTCYRLDTGTAVLKGPKRGSGDGAGDNGGSMMTCSYDDLPVWEDAGVPFKFKFPYVHTAILQHHSKVACASMCFRRVLVFHWTQHCLSFSHYNPIKYTNVQHIKTVQYNNQQSITIPLRPLSNCYSQETSNSHLTHRFSSSASRTITSCWLEPSRCVLV